jgi:hypothetical protein
MTVNERLYELNLDQEFDIAYSKKDAARVKDILLRARVDLPSIKAIIDQL